MSSNDKLVARLKGVGQFILLVAIYNNTLPVEMSDAAEVASTLVFLFALGAYMTGIMLSVESLSKEKKK
jgi:hypothetical protein